MNFPELVTSSVLARALALFILAAALIGAIVVAVVDYLTNRALPLEINNFLYFGLGLAALTAGINIGIVLTPTNKKEGSSNDNTGSTGNNPSQPAA